MNPQSTLILENTKKELIGVYDENDNYIKGYPRIEVRSKNLIHRATDIMVLNEKNEILVQTRSKTKEYCPGFLDAVFGGMVSDKEDVDISAERELGEEAGLDISKLKNKLIKHGKFFYQDQHTSTFEYLYYIFITPEEEKLISFRDHEVSSVKWYSKEDLKKLISEGKEKITGASVQSFNILMKDNCI